MTGLILDGVLMLLLVAALGYGVRLERKLTALRAGQLAFAGAVTELNSAAGRAEKALASLRDAAEEADLLHDRILKARAVKQDLETLIARAPSRPAAAPVTHAEAMTEDESRPRDPVRSASILSDRLRSQSSARGRPGAPERTPIARPVRSSSASSDAVETEADDRALRMAALAQRIQGLSPAPVRPERTEPAVAVRPSRDERPADALGAILGVLNANHAAQESLNRARRNLDEDLFAA